MRLGLVWAPRLAGTATASPTTSKSPVLRDERSRCTAIDSPFLTLVIKANYRFHSKWAKRDSNPRHPACKAGALNQLSYSPSKREAQREQHAVA